MATCKVVVISELKRRCHEIFSFFENSPRDIQVICFSSPSNVHNAFKEKIKIVRQLLLYSFLVGNICYIQYFSITGTDNQKDPCHILNLGRIGHPWAVPRITPFIRAHWPSLRRALYYGHPWADNSMATTLEHSPPTPPVTRTPPPPLFNPGPSLPYSSP